MAMSLDELVKSPGRSVELTPANRMTARRQLVALILLLAEEPVREVQEDTILTLPAAAHRLGLRPDTVKHMPFPRSVRLRRGQYSKLGLDAWERNRRMRGAQTNKRGKHVVNDVVEDDSHEVGTLEEAAEYLRRPILTLRTWISRKRLTRRHRLRHIGDPTLVHMSTLHARVESDTLLSAARGASGG